MEKKVKWLLGFWLLFGVLPAAITRDGGNHATRLILILPPLVFTIAFGWLELFRKIRPNLKVIFLVGWVAIYGGSLAFYLHHYYGHYPRESERWWHFGFKEAFAEIKQIEPNYDRIVISMADEPSWIFFAGWYAYPPRDWQLNFPLAHAVDLPGFGKVSHINKFYFGSPDADIGIYGLDKVIDGRTVYLAVAKEIGANLILEPGRVPPGLKLIKAVAFPSGEPAYYVFTKK